MLAIEEEPMDDSDQLEANGENQGGRNSGPSPIIAYTAQAIGGCGQIATQALEVLKTSTAPADEQEVCRAALEATTQAVLAALELLRVYAASKDNAA
jgi:hypothetical protein